jgi:hypothetical protein
VAPTSEKKKRDLLRLILNTEQAKLHLRDSEISRSSETEAPRAPLTQGSKKTICNASSLNVIVVLSIAALFKGNIHIAE